MQSKTQIAIGFSLAALIGTTGGALAQNAPAAAPQIIRGSVTAVSPDKLVLKTADGKTVTIGLSKDWTVQVTKPITAADIQPGSFIGTAEMPETEGVGRSLEVHVFPPGVKMGEGHYGWDLKKGSMMTNGTVGKVISSAKGRELDVSYSTGQRHIVVPNTVPIVQMGPGDRALIQPGVKIFVVALSTPTGLVSNGVAVGEKGQAPPM